MQMVAHTSWHELPVAEAAGLLETNLSIGLSTAEAQRRQRDCGPNELVEAPSAAWWIKLLGQFNQLVIWILIAATVLSAVLGDWLEAGAILSIVFLNALLGFFQEQKAETALSSLRKISSPMAKAIRDGSLRGIMAKELVPGDLVQLEAGDRVPADVRLITVFGLKTQEAALTGESVPVEKEASAALARHAAIAERVNMAFMGTTAVVGKARGVVAAIGMNTELGRIAGFLKTEEREPTPLQKRLAELGRVLIVVCLVLVAIIFVLQLLRGQS